MCRENKRQDPEPHPEAKTSQEAQAENNSRERGDSGKVNPPEGLEVEEGNVEPTKDDVVVSSGMWAWLLWRFTRVV